MSNLLLNDKEFFALCVDTADGTVKQKDPEGARFSDEAIRQRFFDLLEVSDAKDKYYAMRFQIHQREIFALIIETITEIMPSFYNSEFMNAFVDFRTFNFGEKPVFEVDDMNLFVVSRIANGTWDTRRQKAYGKTDFILDYETYDIYVYDDLFSFLAGRVDFATLIAKVMRSIQFKKEQRILQEFLALPDMANPDFVESGSPEPKRIIELCERVAGMTGAAPILCGTKLALYNILDEIKDYWLSQNMRDEINRTGGLATWKGYTVMPIPTSIEPGTTQIVPNNDKILVLPAYATASGGHSKFIKVANLGTPLIRQINEPQRNQDQVLEYQMQYRMGVGAAVNHHFGVLDFS